jgi:hypothetical protein
MERHNRQIPSHDASLRGRMGRRVALGLSTLVLLAGLSGCGHEASTDAVIFVNAADANWTLPDDYGNGVNSLAPVQPVQILVQKSSDDPTPVPGVEITILAGGVSVASASVLDPVTGAVLDNGAGVYQTRTDDHGAVIVEPWALVTGCLVQPAADASISGNLSLGIFISSDSAAWNGNFTYTCKGP